MAIEIGVTVVLLFALLFLVLDLSMVLFVRSTLQQAVREGVRTGVTGVLHGSTTYLNDSITHVVQREALGFLNGPEGACRVQISYFDPSSGAASTGAQGDIVVVAVRNYHYTPLGAVLKSADPLSISVSSSDVIEKCPVGGCPAAVNPNPPACP